MTTESVALDRYFETETLEVDDSSEDKCSCDEVHDVRKAVAPEGFTKGTSLVIPGENEVEKGDDGTLEFRTTAGVYGCRRECFPDDVLTNGGGNEERNAGTETVTFLEKLIEKDNDEGGNNKLQNQ